jgi:hypothetical protein
MGLTAGLMGSNATLAVGSVRDGRRIRPTYDGSHAQRGNPFWMLRVPVRAAESRSVISGIPTRSVRNDPRGDQPFFTNSDFSFIAPMPSILQSMS